MTLKDIAQELGVSISTVSRVINQKGAHVANKDIQDRIWEIVRQTGYIPSSAARCLKRGAEIKEKNRVIACLYAREPIGNIDSPFFSRMSRSIEEEALHYGYIVKYFFTASDLDNVEKLGVLYDSNVEGLIILGRHNLETIRKMRRFFNKNIIYVGLNPPVDAKYDCILCDGYQIGVDATSYLIKLGHKNIAYIGETKNEVRFDGFVNSLEKSGFAANKDYIVSTMPYAENGYQSLKKLLSLDCRPTAVFCMNDKIAMGAIRAAQDMHVRIPRELSIIGVDDTESSKYLIPKLTTVHVPIDELGAMATKMLYDRLEKGHQINIKMYLPFYIIERESCAKCLNG